MWDYDQRERLALEEKLLAHYMPGLYMNNHTGNTNVTGWITPDDCWGSYHLQLNFPPDYPYDTPALYVTSPQRLEMYNGVSAINDYEKSHTWHTKKNGLGGCVQICHLEYWDASMTSVKVLLMGALWLRAYEVHLESGETIANILKNWKREIEGYG